MTVLFFLLWILLSGKTTVGVCVSGAAVSAVLTFFCCKVMGYRMRGEFRILRKLGSILGYLGYLLKEILKAGFVVMKLVYTRGRDTEPLLVHFHTKLESESARATLANSITLTAGTITVYAEGNHFCVHALDRSLAEGIEDSEFERRLAKLEE